MFRKRVMVPVNLQKRAVREPRELGAVGGGVSATPRS